MEGKGENSFGIGKAMTRQGKKFSRDTMKIGRLAKPESEKTAEKKGPGPSGPKLAGKFQKFAH